jgi:hypothetical protein
MIDDEALRYAASLLGYRFLAYVTGSSEDSISARIAGDLDDLEDEREGALMATLDQALQWAPLPPPPAVELAPDGGRPEGSPADRMRRFAWVDTHQEQSLANLGRVSSGAALPEPPAELDPAERALADAALDYYPVTLIPPPRPDRPFGELPVISDARTRAFVGAVRADGSLDPLLEPGATWYPSTGFGFETQTPERYMACILANAEQEVRAFGRNEAADFVNAAVQGLRAVRELCAHGRAEVPTMIGFAHVDVPEDAELRGPRDGRMRAASGREPALPMATPAALVLETVSILTLASGDLPDSPALDGLEQMSLDGHIVALAGLLATTSWETRALPLSTRVKVFDPLSPFVGSFTDERTGIPTVALNHEDLRRLEEWIRRLETNYHPAVRVAINRCVSAFAERSTPDDALIDLVIALENLFGGRGGELRLRISASLAWLLSSDTEERRSIQRSAKQVYDARSALVHGGELANGEAYEKQQVAEWLLLGAFTRLFVDRPDLLGDSDRASKLILGE